MKTNIFRPLQIGKEVFHPQSYDESCFVMNWTMDAGGMVPPHAHIHMDEHFTITQGEITFSVNGETIVKKVGEELFIPKGITHSIKNTTKGQIGLTVKYTPCADVHRMFEIFATLDEKHPGSMMNMVKYFYIYPRLNLKEFSSPRPEFIMSIMTGVVTLVGKLSGWDKLVKRFEG